MEWIYGICGLILGGAIAAAFCLSRIFDLYRENAALRALANAEKAALERAGVELDLRFRATAQEVLGRSGEHFLQLAQAKLKEAHKDGAHDLEKRQKAIDDLVKPVHQNLESLNKALEQIKGTDTALRDDLRMLSRETAKLVGAMRDPAGHGMWGEFILEGLLEKSGLIRGVHYETQVSLAGPDKRQRPDVMINMQDGFKIIVDAKAPLNEFAARLDDHLSEEEHGAVVGGIARQVRDHVKKLGGKGYWENIESADFVVMFLPSEHVYSIALRFDPDLVDFALQNNVIIASPTLLMSLLRVVSLSWRQTELAKNAKTISEQGLDLYKRLLTFTDHIGKIGGHLQKAMGGYDEAVGSLEKSVLPAARKFRELQGGAAREEIAEFRAIEKIPRQLALTGEDENEKTTLAKKRLA